MFDILTIQEILEQEYSYVGDVCAIVICVFNMVLLLSTYSIKSKNLTLFKYMNLLMSVGAISSILFNIVQNNVTEKNRVFVYLTYNARYVCWSLVFVMLVLPPSFVIRGAPNFLSITTFLPLGPSVTFTAFASASAP